MQIRLTGLLRCEPSLRHAKQAVRHTFLASFYLKHRIAGRIVLWTHETEAELPGKCTVCYGQMQTTAYQQQKSD